MRRSFLPLFLILWSSIAPAEQASSTKFPSPDGRFVLRISEGGQIDLIESTGKILVDLGQLYVDPETSSEEQLFLTWSSDSKWAAYATYGPEFGSGSTTVYFWNGVALEEVRLPANLPEPKMDTDKVKLKGNALKPRKWLKPGELELSNELMGIVRDGPGDCTAKLVITVELTAPHASVKKVGKTKIEVSK